MSKRACLAALLGVLVLAARQFLASALGSVRHSLGAPIFKQIFYPDLRSDEITR